MQRSIDIFLKKHHTPGRPLLLGLSGGHDSRVLWELLVARKHPLIPRPLIVAHVDHGWRAESRREALELKEMVEGQGYPFFLHTLQKPGGGGNLEERCREERYAFFQHLYHEHNCEALLLGHQADDQAETVLKRLFEGAHFTSLSAMRPISAWGGMNVWRPLLECTREEILAFLEERQITALDDRSNYNPAFLRARMRTHLLPDLERAFGKNFRGNLVELAKSFREIEAYFLAKSLALARREVHADGVSLSVSLSVSSSVSLDFSSLDSPSPLEVEVVIKRFLQEEGIALGSRHLRSLVRQLISGAKDKKLQIQKRQLVIDRGQLFVKNP